MDVTRLGLAAMLWTAATVGADDWPMFMRDARRSSTTPEVVQPPVLKSWTFSPPSSRRITPPVVSDGLVFAGASNHRLYALSAETGKVEWEFETDGDVYSTPCIADGVVYFGSDDRHVYALKAANGELAWKAKLGGKVWSSPCVSGNTVYVGCHDHRLYALDAATGETCWSFETGGNVLGAPAAWEDKVLVGSRDHRLYCVDTEGKLQWKVTCVCDLLSPFPVVGERTCVVNPGDGLYLVDLANSTKRRKAGTFVPSQPPATGETTVVMSGGNDLRAVRANGGGTLWQAAVPSGEQGCPPVLTPEAVYFARNRWVYGYSPRERSFVAGVEVDDDVTGLAAADGRLFYSDASPAVGAFEAVDDAETNRAPIAVLVAPPFEFKRRPIRIDATPSRDPDGDTIRVEFDGDLGEISQRTPRGFWTTYRVSGTKPIHLVVTDAKGASTTVVSEIEIINRPPVPLITGPHQVVERAHVYLDGSQSWDPDGDAIVAYEWYEILGRTRCVRRFFSPGPHPIRLNVWCNPLWPPDTDNGSIYVRTAPLPGQGEAPGTATQP